MTTKEANKLPPGLYRVYWRDGNGDRGSLAAIGATETGRRWVAPTTSSGSTTSAVTWRAVVRVEPIDF